MFFSCHYYIGSSSSNTLLTITGSRLADTESNHTTTVSIGGEPCNVTTMSTNEIQCLIGEGPVGTYDVIVVVNDLGQANGTFKFSYLFEIDSLTPSAGSVAGM